MYERHRGDDRVVNEVTEWSKEMNFKLFDKEGANLSDYIPTRGHSDDAGIDLRTPYTITIKAGGSASIETGVGVQIPKGYFGKLESKSGLNVRNSIVSLGGVIDCGYTGEIIAKLYNFGDEDYTFNAGDKIVQMIVQPCLIEGINFVEDFEDTERGNGGFGSTGK